jgi:hypothetical protein
LAVSKTALLWQLAKPDLLWRLAKPDLLWRLAKPDLLWRLAKPPYSTSMLSSRNSLPPAAVTRTAPQAGQA